VVAECARSTGLRISCVLIRHSDKFDDPNRPGVMQVTVMLKPVLCGTELSVVQEGIPEVIPVEMCCLGWQESLVQIAMLVEPDIQQEPSFRRARHWMGNTLALHARIPA